MGLSLFKEKRLSERRRLTGLMPGRLVYADGRRDVVCKPVDVSAHGLGIVLAKELSADAQMLLLLQGREVALSIAWCQPDFGKQDMFRYGLTTIDPSVNLEAIFVEAGCLK